MWNIGGKFELFIVVNLYCCETCGLLVELERAFYFVWCRAEGCELSGITFIQFLMAVCDRCCVTS